MNAVEFKQLAEACDCLLTAPDSSVERVSVPFLHVMHEHPVFLQRYAGFLEGRQFSLSSMLRRMASKCRLGMRSAMSDGSPWHSRGEPPANVDVLFVSHMLNASQARSSEDFYFGSVPAKLVESGKTVAAAYLNQSLFSPERLVKEWPDGPVSRFLLSRQLGVKAEFELFRRLRGESVRLRNHAAASSSEYGSRLAVKASVESIGGAAMDTLRIGEQIGGLCALLRPKVIVTTHEGHGWERLAFAAARRACPGVRCVGYHQTILFPMQHALKRRLGSPYDPDFILTAGTVTRDQLAKAPGLSGIPVGVLGTNRCPKGGAAAEPAGAIQGEPPSCLVIPEGIECECLTLFDFALRCAAAAPDIRFLLRMHPVLPFAKVAAKDARLRSLPSNVVLSTAKIEEDFGRCRWALYRGSSAALQATLAGLRPFYVPIPDELPIDPLHELREWKCVADTPESFSRQVSADISADRASLLAPYETAARYCGRYFEPLDPGALLSLMDGHG